MAGPQGILARARQDRSPGEGILARYAERRRQPVGPALGALAQMGLEMLPGSGDFIAARDSQQAGALMAQAFRQGEYGEALKQGALSVAHGLGALPMLPAMAGVIKAYHGSPHRFDKFSMGKIGEGEGAQAFGHGLYFAEDPDVAASYYRKLNGEDAVRMTPDVQAEIRGKWDDITSKLRGARARQDSARYARQLDEADKIGDEVSLLEKQQDDLFDWGIQETIRRNPGYGQRGFYEVTLKPDHEDLLDWDAPLSEQSPKVREALEKLRSDYKDITGSNALDGDVRGSQFYQLLS
ncbi:MAG: hypothetical protein OEU92_30930, partial [Alphaproteobacteria bacterium]|nr:hypothetical protein [Alphaproteobacteria bacterium]